jgi:TolB-like protein
MSQAMESNKNKAFWSPRGILLQLACQLLAIAILLAGFAGCSKRYSDIPAYTSLPFREYKNQGVGRFKTSYLAEQIDAYYRGTNPGPIGVSTFVNLDDLYTTSSFGRMVGEQLISELAMKGFDVVELRHADALQFMAPDGEFALSRDVSAIHRQRDLGGIVVGTYSVSPVRVYLNVRLINPSNSLVLSAGSVEMPKTNEISKMLRGGGLPGTLERIPVRHLANSTFPMGMQPARYVDPLEAGSANGAPTWAPNEVAPQFSEPAPSVKPLRRPVAARVEPPPAPVSDISNFLEVVKPEPASVGGSEKK